MHSHWRDKYNVPSFVHMSNTFQVGGELLPPKGKVCILNVNKVPYYNLEALETMPLKELLDTKVGIFSQLRKCVVAYAP